MTKPLFDETQIGSILKDLWRERDRHLTRLRVRRALMEMSTDTLNLPQTGTNVPESYRKSELIIRHQSGDVNRGVQNYASRIAANEPQVSVIPVSLGNKDVGKRVEEHAAEQERLLMSQWDAVGGRSAQDQVTWSQAWGRVGWYLTLPRDASWGLPDREFFTELDDDEIETMKRSGSILPDMDEDGRHVESASTWLERRRKAGKSNAVSDDARALFTLRAVAPDMVLPRYDNSGSGKRSLKYAFMIEELPHSDFQPGSELARAAATFEGFEDQEQIDKYGLVIREGKIEGAVTLGGEPHSQQQRDPWVLATFLTRTEVYMYVTNTRGTINGKIVYHDEHGGGRVPLIPVPGKVTDSLRPGGEYTSMMEQVFAAIPIINQLSTVLSNTAVWNSFARWYVVDPDTPRDEDGEPMVLTTSDDVPGMDPGQVSIARGEIKQLKIDADLMLGLLQFYTERLDQQMPASVTEGTAGASAAAWQVRQLLEASGELVTEAVDNHADAVKEVMLLWIRWMRMLDEPVYSFAAPGRRSGTSTRGLIEFDPKDLTDTITINQNPQSAQQRIVLDQVGVEKLSGGLIDDRQYYEEFALESDPEEAMLRADVQKLRQAVMFGDVTHAPPGSMMDVLVQMAKGEITMQMLERSPAFAVATVTQMEEEAFMASQQQLPSPDQTNVAQAAGQVQPGLGMSTTQPGAPGGGAPQGAVV